MVLDTQVGVEATPGAAFSPSAPANKQAKRRTPPAGGPPPLVVFMLLGACGAGMILYLSTLGEEHAGARRSSRYRPYVSRNAAALAPWWPSLQAASTSGSGPRSAGVAAAATRNATRKRRAPSALLNTSLAMLRSRAPDAAQRGAAASLPVGAACLPPKPAACHPPPLLAKSKMPVAVQAARGANANSGATARTNTSTSHRTVYKQ